MATPYADPLVKVVHRVVLKSSRVGKEQMKGTQEKEVSLVSFQNPVPQLPNGVLGNSQSQKLVMYNRSHDETWILEIVS